MVVTVLFALVVGSLALTLITTMSLKGVLTVKRRVLDA
jgi:hypothetical protein